MNPTGVAIVSSDWNECLAPCGPFDFISFIYPQIEYDLADVFRQYTDNRITLGEAAGTIRNLMPASITSEQIDAYLDDSFERIERKLTNASVRGIVGLKNKPLKQVYLERSRLYPEYADITINCRGGESEDEMVDKILSCLPDMAK